MKIEEVKYDCKYFKGHIPCIPNKEHHVTCATCNFYQKNTHRILIIKLGALGDVIRTTPLITAYRKKYPNAHFTWLTLTPDILPKKEINEILKLDAISLFVLSQQEFDIAINLDKEIEACLLLTKVQAKEKYGYLWDKTANKIIPATHQAIHKLMTGFFDDLSKKNTKSYQEEIFEICHLDFTKEEYLLDIDEQYNRKWNKILREKANGKKIIGLNTGCGSRWLTRLWKQESWVALINLLQENHYFPVVLGGTDEHQTNTDYAHLTGVYYPGTYSLKEFIAISNNCDTVVTAVSMMMHIAIALKKKLVLFNNIFNKHEFDLYDRGIIIEPSSGCSCYYGNTCKREIHCMQDITASQVYEAIVQL